MTNLVSETIGNELREIRGRSFYLALQPSPVFAVLHTPQGRARSNTGVVLCPPFGWDELCAHRALREWAHALARTGHPALRFDFPATGDSGGSAADPDLLGEWTATVGSAAASLRETTDCDRVVAIGLGFGGMLACRAVAFGAAIDDLVLWSVPPRGRLLLRELRAFAQLVEPEPVRLADGQRQPPDDASLLGAGALNASGFVLSAQTVSQLEALDLTALPVPDASRRRILLLGRDAGKPDRRLSEHFALCGAKVTLSRGPGYGAMMIDPQFAKAPREVFARTNSWLAEAAPRATLAGGEEVRAVATVPRASFIELTVGDVVIREAPFEFDFGGEQLSGVLTEPVTAAGDPAQLCAVLLNAGAVRRIGHHRISVEVARRWAAQGVPTLRLDVVGVGDSDGAVEFHSQAGFQRREFANQVLAALDELERRGLPGRFIVGGLCSGAYWGLHAALADDRVRGLLLVNLVAFFWSDELGAARDARRARTLLRERELGEIVRIVATDRWRLTRMARARLRNAHPGRLRHGPGDHEVPAALDALRDGDVETLLLLSFSEPLFDDFVADALLERLGEWPNLHLDRVATNDHVFRSLWSQRQVHEALDGALGRTLAETGRRAETD